MPPQGQTQGLSYKDQDKDQDLGGKDKDKDKDNNTGINCPWEGVSNSTGEIFYQKYDQE